MAASIENNRDFNIYYVRFVSPTRDNHFSEHVGMTEKHGGFYIANSYKEAEELAYKIAFERSIKLDVHPESTTVSIGSIVLKEKPWNPYTRYAKEIEDFNEHFPGCKISCHFDKEQHFKRKNSDKESAERKDSKSEVVSTNKDRSQKGTPTYNSKFHSFFKSWTFETVEKRWDKFTRSLR